MKFRKAYDERKRHGFETVGESLTQQHFGKEADIKNIIKKHDRTGIISHVARGVASYGDYSMVNEYREALDIVNASTASFMELPADIRKQFNNDPGEFFEFATDPKNGDKMVALGLAEAPPLPEDRPHPEPLQAVEEAPAQDKKS